MDIYILYWLPREVTFTSSVEPPLYTAFQEPVSKARAGLVSVPKTRVSATSPGTHWWRCVRFRHGSVLFGTGGVSR